MAAAAKGPVVSPSWVMGKTGAYAQPDLAVRLWDTRQMVTAYLRESVENNRTGHLKRHLQKYPLSV